jgi:uncharacterized membrane protein
MATKLLLNFKSDLSGIEFPRSERISAKTIRKSILELIIKDHPNFGLNSYLSSSELNRYREKFIEFYLKSELGQLSELEETVLKSIKDEKLLSENADDDCGECLQFGQRIADKVAYFGGSWRFIIFFGAFIAVWISTNVIWMANREFDPYPFILLNLLLSCLAALQAPVIMMSQNRQEEKDRERSKKDYMINLKSELEIRMLHEKLDHLILHQQQELVEIQQLQMDMMDDILNKLQNRPTDRSK